jgi:ATP-dependent Lhr-like helicase
MVSDLFHPLLWSWFTETYGRPTGIQEAAWPCIARGEHVLALAPTGSGKTLTAFLGALSRFIDGTYRADRLSVLYVSPLKALNEDIRRNLLEPIAAAAARFAREGAAFPEIRVDTRSGDTPQAERRRFLLKPPSILALTPESLAIILLNPRGRQVLSTVRLVILDEIHAVLGTKRGCFLSCQVDRLGLAAGEFQRVALSATVRPPAAAADFVGGLRGPGEKRPVRVLSPAAEKDIRLVVDFPAGPPMDKPADKPAGEAAGAAIPPPGGAGRGPDRYGRRYRVLTGIILEHLAQNRTTLVFTDSRQRAERIAFLLNQGAGRTVAFAHHGSLSREIRRGVEQRLAEGRLPCVVATGSLELGIDIGSVDEVILAGSPSLAAAALQRIGRSGHGVGLTSRGLLVPFHGMDLVLAAALAGALRDREIEETRPIENPLDILAQIILALCVEEDRPVDGLYETLRGFYVFQNLPRRSYDQVIGMLTGRYRDIRLRELKPRLYLDRETGTLSAVKGVLPLLYASGGVIANRGYYSMRLADGTKIGELDEEFVWERRLGDSFDFGSRPWRIVHIGSEAVEVVPRERAADYIPFWRADTAFRSPVLARRVLELFEAFGDASPEGFMAELRDRGLTEEAAAELAALLGKQRKAQGRIPLPGRDCIPVEVIDDPVKGKDTYSVMIHGFRGGAVHYPLAMALAAELEERLGLRVEALPDDNAVLLLVPRFTGEEPEALVRGSLRRLGEDGAGERLFRRRLESSGVFGAAFREAAERSLLLPRAGFGKRTPLWITRQRAKRLFDAAAPYGDFPALAEAWRSCLADRFDLPGFREILDRLREGSLRAAFFRTQEPSPFSRDISWKETGAFMYEYDERKELRGASLSEQVIEEVLGKAGGGAAEAGALPPLPRALAEEFAARLRREIPGWAPDDELSLAEWVKERIAIPRDEWEALLGALPPELRERCRGDPSLGGRIGMIRREGAALPSAVHREWAELWREGPLSRLGPWLRYEGLVSPGRIAAVFGLSPGEAAAALEALAETGDLVRGLRLKEGAAEDLAADRENLGFLLRLSRKKARPLIRERPPSLLAPFLARRQGILAAADGAPTQPWENLAGLVLPAPLWETEIFPARRPSYLPETLDRELEAGRLLWYGAGKERAAFCPVQDLDLCLGESGEEPFGKALPADFFDRPRDFWEIKEALGADSPACLRLLWDEVWEGRLSADSWAPLRRALEQGFIPRDLVPEAGEEAPAFPPYPGGRQRRVPRAIRNRWRGGPPAGGRWFSLAPDYGLDGPDPPEEEERNRDRVRLLLARWGVLCRPLLEREGPAFSWARLLPAIRRLELAGELVAGRFFSGLNSLQFASPDIEGELREAEGEGAVFGINAADPASPAGIAAEGLDPALPPRSASARLCFRGGTLLAVSGRGGRDLRVLLPPGDGALGELPRFVKFPRARAVSPPRKITLETINGEAAAGSPYAEVLKDAGFIPDRGKLLLW